MSRIKKSRALKPSTISVDLYQERDGLLQIPDSERIGQKETHSTNISLPLLLIKIQKSGWNKPTILLAMMIGLEKEGLLTIGGLRRFHQLMSSQTSDVIMAANLRSHISSDPHFTPLKEWVNRNYSFHSFRRKKRRRIGVGYRDKGSLPPFSSRTRNRLRPNQIFLGKNKKWLWNLEPRIALLIQDYGYLLNYQGGGYWEPDVRLKMHFRSLAITDPSFRSLLD